MYEENIYELETNNNNKYIRYLYRGINAFKKVYQRRTIVVKDESGLEYAIKMV
jgi:hypothetical protein